MFILRYIILFIVILIISTANFSKGGITSAFAQRAKSSGNFSTHTVLHPSTWDNVPNWYTDQFEDVLPAFERSCEVLKRRSEWRSFCNLLNPFLSPDQLKQLVEQHLKPYQLIIPEGQESGMITGYYEPLLRGSQIKTDTYQYPIYQTPSDLLVLDPPVKIQGNVGLISRARMEAGEYKPYYTRGDLMRATHLDPYVICWVSDPIELFFLHVQGSGRILFENGEILRVGFDNHNGYPYRSIAQVLIEQGDLTPSNASMQHIQKWAADNPDKVEALLEKNPRFIFFRKLPDMEPSAGPIGALGVPLTPKRSLAVDLSYQLGGLPIFLSTTMPNSSEPLNRLMFAQDTGSAIIGPIRADFFWGDGSDAGFLAGKMKQQGRMWVLLPEGYNWKTLSNKISSRYAQATKIKSKKQR